MVDHTLAGNVIVDGGEVLLLHRRDHDYWELPGGKVEDGETPRAAAVREAAEEIGVTVRILSSLGRLEMTFDHDGATYRIRAFISEIVDGEPTPEEDRFSELGWFDEQRLQDLDLAPNLDAKRDALRLLLLRSQPGSS